MCSKLFNLSFLLTQILAITMKSKFQCLQSWQTQSTLSAMLSAAYRLMTTPSLCTGVLNYWNATSSHPLNTDFTPVAHDKQLHPCKYVHTYMYTYKYYMYCMYVCTALHTESVVWAHTHAKLWKNHKRKFWKSYVCRASRSHCVYSTYWEYGQQLTQ